MYKFELAVDGIDPLVTVIHHLFHLLLAAGGALQYRGDLMTLMCGVCTEDTDTLSAGLTYKPGKWRKIHKNSTLLNLSILLMLYGLKHEDITKNLYFIA